MGAPVSLLERIQLRVQRHVTRPFEHRVAAPVRRLRNAGRSFRPIFVAGASGSGTSFLAVALGQHFECAGVVYEMDEQVSPSSVLSVPSIEAFPDVASYRAAVLPSPSWSLDEVRRDLLALCRAYASRRGEAMILKGPDLNLVRAELMHRCFPDARFVMIFREPVANIEGWRRKWSTFRRDELDTVVRFYSEMHESFLKSAEAFPERVVGIQYEALIERPDELLDRIGSGLGLARAPRPRRLPPTPNVEGRGIRNVRGGRIGVVRDANRRARERLRPEEVEAIEGTLGPLYERMRHSRFTIAA